MVLFLMAEKTKADGTYTTNFPNTENPISEGGNWINGGTTGLDWGNVETTPGKVFGNQTPSSPPYKDPTAILSGSWGADQTAEGTVYSINPNANYYQEVEIRLRTSISAHSITGYEIFSRCLKTGAAYVSIVRWNGPLGDFSELAHFDGSQYGVQTGDVLKATIIGNVITGYINDVQVIQATDNTYTTGNPGVGFNYGVGNTNADFGFTSFSASSGPPSTSDATISAGGPTTFCKGGNVVLTVAAAGLTYQWKRGNKNISGATQQNYAASKTATYKCDVSNSFGTTTSNSISVTSNPTPTVSISQAPCSGHAVLLTCNANPNSGITFQWQKGNMMLGGATNSTFSATQNATYKCVVTITATGCSKKSAGSSVTITCKSGDVEDDNNVVVYPNPSSDYFNVNTSQLNPQSDIYIYDLTGRLVESHIVDGSEMKIGKTLSNGVYFLKIAENGETRQVIKLVKNF